jgi:hypothetical protein
LFGRPVRSETNVADLCVFFDSTKQSKAITPNPS